MNVLLSTLLRICLIISLLFDFYSCSHLSCFSVIFQMIHLKDALKIFFHIQAKKKKKVVGVCLMHFCGFVVQSKMLMIDTLFYVGHRPTMLDIDLRALVVHQESRSPISQSVKLSLFPLPLSSKSQSN